VALFVSEDRNELLQAAVSVGCAVELIAKAFVASVEHTLLADKGETDAILILADKGHLDKVSPTDLKSITATEGLLRAKRLHPTLVFNVSTPSDQIVLKVRNAAAHMALVDRTELRRAVLVMCRVIEGLLTPLGLEREPFWGSFALPVVDELLDQAIGEVRKLIVAKVAAARQRLRDMLEGLDANGRALVVASLTTRRTLGNGEHNEPQQCPACDEQGWLLCVVIRNDVEYEADEDGHVGALVPRTGYPYAFECPVCELELDEIELAELQLPMVIELAPDTEPEEVYGEPDEDLGRDR
jgi:hypothetical protein